MVDVLSPRTVEWICAAFGSRAASVHGGGIPDGDLAWRISGSSAEESVVHLKDRGAPAEEYLRGRREYVERWWVWTAGGRVRAGRGIWEEPAAPRWTTAPDGPLSVRRTEEALEVVAQDRVVMTFRHGGNPVEFTHYGYLPVDLLIREIEKPPQESVFHLEPARSYRRGWQRRFQRRNRDAPERIRRWAVEQLAARDGAGRATGAQEEDA